MPLEIKKIAMSHSDINQALQICYRNNVKVYPVNVNWKWYIEADINGKKKRFSKAVQPKEVNESVTKTYIHYANQL